MSAEDLADEPGSDRSRLVSLINAQMELGVTIIHLDNFGSVLGKSQIAVERRAEETLTSAIERGRIVVQRYLRGHAVEDEEPSKYLNLL